MKKIIVAILLLMAGIVEASQYRIVSASRDGVTIYRVEKLYGNGKWGRVFFNDYDFNVDIKSLKKARVDKKRFEKESKFRESVENWKVVE